MVHLVCTKQDKIDQLESDMKTLKRVVLEGNGGDSLQFIARETRDNQKTMSDQIWKISSNVEGLIKFQNRVETERDLKLRQRDKRLGRNSWLIPTIISGIVAIVTTILVIHFT